MFSLRLFWGLALLLTYLKSNLDLSNFTCTSLLSSTQNSTKTESRLSYHLATAGCLVRSVDIGHQLQFSCIPILHGDYLRLTKT